LADPDKEEEDMVTLARARSSKTGEPRSANTLAFEIGLSRAVERQRRRAAGGFAVWSLRVLYFYTPSGTMTADGRAVQWLFCKKKSLKH
jgi:hypothetical protein